MFIPRIVSYKWITGGKQGKNNLTEAEIDNMQNRWINLVLQIRFVEPLLLLNYQPDFDKDSVILTIPLTLYSIGKLEKKDRWSRWKRDVSKDGYIHLSFAGNVFRTALEMGKDPVRNCNCSITRKNKQTNKTKHPSAHTHIHHVTHNVCFTRRHLATLFKWPSLRRKWQQPVLA